MSGTYRYRYQQEGFNWLMFLNRYQLHGVLCDDMGLGKTLQTICLVLASYEDLSRRKQTLLPSIVVCPPTLVGHWFYEVERFVKDKALDPLLYAGPPGDRARLRQLVPKHNLIIASYDIVRNDVDFFAAVRWNYCILDEGHVIKNGKTKMAKAIKQLTASHR
jgi:TATA-binding protein-associated factor